MVFSLLLCNIYCKGLSIKYVRSQWGEGVYPVRTRGSGSLQKLRIFFKNYGMSALKGGGVKPGRIFCGQEDWLIFLDFVWTYFMDSP